MGQINGRGKRTHAPQMVEVDFSFQIVTAGGTPVVFRQAKADIIQSVARDSAGLFTVTFKQGLPGLPRQLTGARVDVHEPDATLTAGSIASTGGVINLAITRTNPATVQVYTQVANGAGAPAIADPSDDAWVSVHLVGPMVDERCDAV